MAISNLVDSVTTYDRPSVFSRAANDNIEKQSSDFLKLAISDFSSFLSKTNDSFENLKSFSEKTIDGFKAIVKDLTNLEKNIRFKFTYLRKEIESSRNDFLTALKALSFDFAGGDDGEGRKPLDAGKPGTSIGSAGGGGDGGPPPIIPPGGGGGKDGRKPPTTPKTTTPRTNTSRAGIGGRTPPTVTRESMTARRPPGTPQRVTPPLSKPAAPIINIPGASVSTAYTPPARGVSGRNVTGLTGTGTASFGLPNGYTASLPTPPTPDGAPQKTKFTKEQFTNEIRSSKAGKMAARVGGPALMALEAVIGSLMAYNEWLKYKETGNKQHLKNAYAIGGSTAGGLSGFALGAAPAALLGGPAAPLTGLVGGIIGAAKGAEQGEIVGRALYNVNNENMDFSDAFKLEALRYSYEKNQAELENKLNIITERLKLAGVDDIEQLPRAGRSAARKMMNDINKLSQEGGNKQNAVKSFERELQEKSKSPDSTQSNQQSSVAPPAGVMHMQMVGGMGIGGPAEPQLAGDKLEYESRQTNPETVAANLRNIEMQALQPEIYNQSEENVVGENTNHPTGPYTAAFTEQEMGGDTVHKFIQRQMNSIPGIENRLM